MLGRIAVGASAMLAIASLLTAADSAHAQCRLCETPATALKSGDSREISLSVDATLDFDRLVLIGSGDGTARLSPNGDNVSSGSIAAISGRAMVGAVGVRGEAGQERTRGRAR